MKSYRGQQFVPTKDLSDLHEDEVAQAPYNDKEGMISLDAYLIATGVRDPVQRAAMCAYTKVKSATPQDWTNIFAGFLGR